MSSRHGRSTFSSLVLAGLRATDGLTLETDPETELGQPRWSRRFERLLDAYETELSGDLRGAQGQLRETLEVDLADELDDDLVERTVNARATFERDLVLGRARGPANGDRVNVDAARRLADAPVLTNPNVLEPLRGLAERARVDANRLEIAQPEGDERATPVVAAAVEGVLDVLQRHPDPRAPVQARELWNELFGWTQHEFDRFLHLPLADRWCFIIVILCCAKRYRRNTFGRLFKAAELSGIPSDADLESLSNLMNSGFNPRRATSSIPIGFVFLGQFIDHDITLDTTTRLTDLRHKAETIVNVRTPSFDLDSLYRDGPEGSPDLYDQDPHQHGYFLLGANGRDLQRNSQGRALIGDPRNDENTLVSQLHLQFLLFHNAVLRMIRNSRMVMWGRCEPHDEAGDFEFARRLVRWHYQWIIVHEWLPLHVEPTVLEAALAIVGIRFNGAEVQLPTGYEKARDFFRSLSYIDCCGQRHCGPLIPVEFSGAAFRFAHSQVRSRYDVNSNRLDVPLFEPKPPALGSFEPVPSTDVVEWHRFFQFPGSPPPQMAESIDTLLAEQLFRLPFAPNNPRDRSLAFRNLRRSARVYALPTGYEVAKRLGLKFKMGPVATNRLKSVFPNVKQAPLWYYCLGEAEHYNGQLGPVGGLLVAVTLLRILKCDPESYVNGKCKPNTPRGWRPVLMQSARGQFTMADLIRIANAECRDCFPS